ncbi:MAG: FCD domain-containing protein [Candidatus Nanopelagicales bacterium]
MYEGDSTDFSGGTTTEYQRLADDVRDRIVSGRLAPGDRLIEADLAEEYHVSRGTVREAIRLLASQRLVETVRGRSGGTFIARVAPESIAAYLDTTVGALLTQDDVALSDLVEVRQLIEPFAASLAASRSDARTIEELVDLQAHANAPDRDEMNWAWHRAILRLSGNPLLPALAMPVYNVLSTRFDRRQAKRGQWQRIEREHAEISHLIGVRDPKGAEEAMREHLQVVHLAYLDLAEQTPPAGLAN